MDYRQTLDYLFSKLPLFSRIGAAAYKADLHNTRRICTFLDEPHQHFKSIHIAGTNGKGSTSHMLAAIFQSAGYKTGLYTSPHLKDFRERIKINGKMISEADVINYTEKLVPLIDEIKPSFFEITVGMAFRYFADQQIDLAIIETGLGGRLDSTNIITPELSVITNIGWDHMNMLGDTLEKIAAEKAGIIKPGIPVVIGHATKEVMNVFVAEAENKKSALSIASEKRHVTDWKWENHDLVADVASRGNEEHKRYHLDLTGVYQLKNLLTVLEACAIMQAKGWRIEESHIREGLGKAKKITGLFGRWEMVSESPLVILDVAHNEDGIRQLVSQVETSDPHHLHLVIGLVKDKDISKVLSLLPADATYYFTEAQIPRALPAAELSDAAAGFGLQGNIYQDVNQALSAAKDAFHEGDMILVCGSVFLVGEITRPVHAGAPGHT